VYHRSVSAPTSMQMTQASTNRILFKWPRAFALAAIVLGVSACNPVYQLDIQQGNLFSKTQVESLKPGMSKRQVMLTMGSPSVVNPFQQSRWDYVSTFRRGNGRMETKDLVLYFDGDSLSKIDGDYFSEDPVELIRLATKYKRQYPDEKRSDEDKKKRGGGDDTGA